MAYVSAHAAQRYVERIEPDLTIDQARAMIMLSARTIDIAARFGATAVKLSNGARLMLRGDVVSTVKQSMRPERRPVSRAMLKQFRRGVSL